VERVVGRLVSLEQIAQWDNHITNFIEPEIVTRPPAAVALLLESPCLVLITHGSLKVVQATSRVVEGARVVDKVLGVFIYLLAAFHAVVVSLQSHQLIVQRSAPLVQRHAARQIVGAAALRELPIYHRVNIHIGLDLALALALALVGGKAAARQKHCQ
jgi:hypothetical protein